MDKETAQTAAKQLWADAPEHVRMAMHAAATLVNDVLPDESEARAKFTAMVASFMHPTVGIWLVENRLMPPMVAASIAAIMLDIRASDKA